MKIKNIPIYERPRERAIRYGIDKISNQELLALIIGKGVRNNSALDIAGNLLRKYTNFINLKEANLKSLNKESGLSIATSLKLLASFEIHRRILQAINEGIVTIKSAENVYQLYSFLGNEKYEMFIILMLNLRGHILKEKRMYIGTGESLPLNCHEILSELLETDARKFVIVHNHPRGEKYPSEEDIEATLEIKEKAILFHLLLYDHVIIYQNGYYSFKEHNMLDMA